MRNWLEPQLESSTATHNDGNQLTLITETKLVLSHTLDIEYLTHRDDAQSDHLASFLDLGTKSLDKNLDSQSPTTRGVTSK